MKGVLGFDWRENRDVLYVPRNFILFLESKKLTLDFDPSHLEELSLYFNEKPINPRFVDIIDLPERLLKEFRNLSYVRNPDVNKKALEIYMYAKDLANLNHHKKNLSFLEYAMIRGGSSNLS